MEAHTKADDDFESHDNHQEEITAETDNQDTNETQSTRKSESDLDMCDGSCATKDNNDDNYSTRGDDNQDGTAMQDVRTLPNEPITEGDRDYLTQCSNEINHDSTHQAQGEENTSGSECSAIIINEEVVLPDCTTEWIGANNRNCNPTAESNAPYEATTHQEETCYHRLTDEEAILKLQDPNVTEHSDATDNFRDITITDLSKLQHIDKSHPAVKRLFMRPRVTAQEVKRISIDTDIKSLVQEFLKSNMTGNFGVARVMKENYATFHSWLATNLQVERNAWAARLKQALSMLEQHRKNNNDARDLVMRSAIRLRDITETCRVNMSCGLLDKGNKGNSQMDHLPADTHSTSVKYPINSQHRDNMSASHSLSEVESRYQCNRKSYFQQRITTLGQHSERPQENVHLSQPSNKLIASATSGNDNVICERKPIVRSSLDGDKNRDNLSMKIAPAMGGSKHANNCRDQASKSENQCDITWNETIIAEAGGLEIDQDSDTNWNEILNDSIETLMEICETNANDRTNCLQLLGVGANQCHSLVEAVTTFTQDRHSNGINRGKEIEKMLAVLGKENKNLIDEMTALQNTLEDKNTDALNLQNQLDRLEEMLGQSERLKVDKCVGTEDTVVKLINKQWMTSLKKTHSGRDISNKSIISCIKYNTSPYANDKMEQSVTGIPILMSQSKQLYGERKAKKLGQIINGLPGTQSKCSRSKEDTRSYLNAMISDQKQPVREKSLIEISEEKLKILKHRAKKLQESLYEAISRIESLDRAGPSELNSTIPASTTEFPWSANHNFNNQTFGKTPSFQMTEPYRNSDSAPVKPSSLTNRKEVPRIIVKTPSTLKSSSLIVSPHTSSEWGPATSGLRMRAEKLLDTASVSRLNCSDSSERLSPHCHSQEGGHNHKHYSCSEDENNPGATHLMSLSPYEPRMRVNSRSRNSGKGIVSKCLRCQKRFSSAENHKLACCYHAKDMKSIEHYDHSGKLVKVLYVYNCCLQAQESEGCVYGHHV